MGKETFMERQRFMDSWIGKIVAGIAFVILMILLLKAIQTPTWAMSVPVFCTALVLYMMVGATLYTKIDQRGVHYQFKPFHGRTRTIPWDNIRGSVVRRYSPLREYGGWGIRFSASGLALNVTGHYGLQLVLQSGKQVLIGTQRRNQMEDAIRAWRPAETS